jgi:hypothetical protein
MGSKMQQKDGVKQEHFGWRLNQKAQRGQPQPKESNHG